MAFAQTASFISIAFLAAVLFLPAVLILFTTPRWIYLYWMAIYLLSLPIWNFFLPLYAFWHFDDFSWGQTRMVEGEQKDKRGHASDHSKAQEVPMMQWVDWALERKKLN
jgi:chitin synthase